MAAGQRGCDKHPRLGPERLPGLGLESQPGRPGLSHPAGNTRAPGQLPLHLPALPVYTVDRTVPGEQRSARCSQPKPVEPAECRSASHGMSQRDSAILDLPRGVQTLLYMARWERDSPTYRLCRRKRPGAQLRGGSVPSTVGQSVLRKSSQIACSPRVACAPPVVEDGRERSLIAEEVRYANVGSGEF